MTDETAGRQYWCRCSRAGGSGGRTSSCWCCGTSSRFCAARLPAEARDGGSSVAGRRGRSRAAPVARRASGDAADTAALASGTGASEVASAGRSRWTSAACPGGPAVGAPARAQNPRWGHRRICGELRKLGFIVAATSIRRLLSRAGLEPAPRRGGPSWRDFLKSQASRIIASQQARNLGLD